MEGEPTKLEVLPEPPSVKKSATGLFYDVRQLNHVNLFDSDHPEHPGIILCLIILLFNRSSPTYILTTKERGPCG
jgi:hypothetical protein